MASKLYVVDVYKKVICHCNILYLRYTTRMKKSLPYYVGFSHFLGIGPRKYKKLLARFGDVISAYTAPVTDIQQIVGEKTGAEFDSFRSTFLLDKEVRNIQKQNIHIIHQESPLYPDQLQYIYDAPICLYVKGQIEKYDFSDNHYISIVGSRKTTSYGRSIARKFGKELADAGWCVVSGMALGIDGQAHWGALEGNGKTIAILGCGVEIVYPWEHRELYKAILSQGGLIISEFPPQMQVRKGYFVTRNRLISALSLGTVVIEGTISSGSLITARHALEQGKDVFACPGNITSDMSRGPHMLIQNGAKLITSVDDILEEYDEIQSLKKQEDVKKLLNKEELMVYEKLLIESATIDSLCQSLTLRAYEVLPLLSSLEMKNIIKLSDQGLYECIM